MAAGWLAQQSVSQDSRHTTAAILENQEHEGCLPRKLRALSAKIFHEIYKMGWTARSEIGDPASARYKCFGFSADEDDRQRYFWPLAKLICSLLATTSMHFLWVLSISVVGVITKKEFLWSKIHFTCYCSLVCVACEILKKETLVEAATVSSCDIIELLSLLTYVHRTWYNNNNWY